MASHFGLPAQELEADLRSKGPQPVRPAAKPARRSKMSPCPISSRPPTPHASSMTRNSRPTTLTESFDELKHVGFEALWVPFSQDTATSDVLYDASEGLKGALQRARDLLPQEESSLEQAFGSGVSEDEASSRSRTSFTELPG